MEKDKLLALREDIDRIMPIITRRNNCYNDDVVKAMSDIVNKYSQK